MPAEDQAYFLHKGWLKDRQFGPIHLALGHVHTRNGHKEWVILTDDPTDLHTVEEWSWRFDLEDKFLDDKSAGFQMESGEIRSAEALDRLG